MSTISNYRRYAVVALSVRVAALVALAALLAGEGYAGGSHDTRAIPFDPVRISTYYRIPSDPIRVINYRIPTHPI
jgi:hypothetical protein